MLIDSSIKTIAEKWNIQTRPKEKMYGPFEISYSPEARIIAGFKEGVLQLNYGDKATLFIPYYIECGEQGYRVIPPRTNLIFEVELLDNRKSKK
ncbi:FKBP-type peptidyl-prolyl cis-trans isomerase [Leeuwenhoekiella marinoflava]|uniref:Peptidyl-prolyl cis-trans isomerase n=2 Tax=Leeuwenhoekiella marinoflava TaxID=988 RepID=A0A4Q0PR03_9FLAO|nr:FKBP-type peptidyl-prolyl cis-trans isomerase [Leeuwenhoekiella marinoflava]RXG32305.1 FKBP-type peptidyl-prolyl isomerase-like protein [Leeuwenhoekiella marinoflava]SHE79738.1 FKBP-type peptidyl-prolyl cis-trans isomerase [Leeuwenhoekiella marinoflava DSM 3653]